MTDWKTTLKHQQSGHWGKPVKQDGTIEAKIASLIRARNYERDGELAYLMGDNISTMLKELNYDAKNVDDDKVWDILGRDE